MSGEIARLNDRELDRVLRRLERSIRLATAARDLDRARALLRVHCEADRECSRRFQVWLARRRARALAPIDLPRRTQPAPVVLVAARALA